MFPALRISSENPQLSHFLKKKKIITRAFKPAVVYVMAQEITCSYHLKKIYFKTLLVLNPT